MASPCPPASLPDRGSGLYFLPLLCSFVLKTTRKRQQTLKIPNSLYEDKCKNCRLCTVAKTLRGPYVVHSALTAKGQELQMTLQFS